jgi:ATP/maltotriose-dependent transcriptional regulator MalT
MAIALSYQSNAAIIHGDLERAKMLLDESAPLIKEVGSKWALALYCYTSGIVAHEQGNSNLAEEHLEESLSLYRGLENKWGRAYVLNFCGHVKLEKNDMDCALACYKESLHLSKETGNKLGMANALLGFGRLSHTVGNQHRAARLFAAAETLHLATSAPIPAFVRTRFDREVSAARAALGEEVFTVEYEAGKKMAVEQAIEYVLKDNGTLAK